MLRESWTVLRESIGDLGLVVMSEINLPACVDTIAIQKPARESFPSLVGVKARPFSASVSEKSKKGLHLRKCRCTKGRACG